jgi:ACT domain-containing protein
MRAIITVIGKDRVGIIASVSHILAENQVNILDISQTTMREYFTMIMLADLDKMSIAFVDLEKLLHAKGDEIGVSIRMQREDIFDSMHRI